MRSVGIIGVALGLASALGMALLALVARWLTLDQNAAFVAIWGVVFSGGSILSVIEQESARQVTVAEANARPLPGSVGQLTLVGLAGTVVVLIVLSVTPMGRSVFGGSLWLIALSFVALSGFAVQYLVRGVLLGRQRNGWYALVIIAEATLRVLFVIGLMASALEPSVTWAVVGIVVGSFGWVPAIRVALTNADWRGNREPWPVVARRIITLAASTALLAPIMTGYPTLVTAVLGSSAGLATFFAIVTISRVPLVLLSPVQALVVPVTTRALLAGEHRKLSVLQGRLLLGLAGTAVLAALGGYLLGPWAVRLLFGADYIAGPELVAVVLAATVVIAGALLQAAVFVSLERYLLIGATWGSALVAAVIGLSVTGGDATARGTAGFGAASVMACLSASVLLRTALRRVQPV